MLPWLLDPRVIVVLGTSEGTKEGVWYMERIRMLVLFVWGVVYMFVWVGTDGDMS